MLGSWEAAPRKEDEENDISEDENQGQCLETRSNIGHRNPMTVATVMIAKAAQTASILPLWLVSEWNNIKQFSIQHPTYISHYTCIMWKDGVVY